MATLNIRGVPEDLHEDLKRIAKRSGLSLNSLVVLELAAAADRRRNAEALDRLRHRYDGPRPSAEAIVRAVRETREGR